MWTKLKSYEESSTMIWEYMDKGCTCMLHRQTNIHGRANMYKMVSSVSCQKWHTQPSHTIEITIQMADAKIWATRYTAMSAVKKYVHMYSRGIVLRGGLSKILHETLQKPQLCSCQLSPSWQCLQLQTINTQRMKANRWKDVKWKVSHSLWLALVVESCNSAT